MGTMISLNEIYNKDEIDLGLTAINDFSHNEEVFACLEHYCDNPRCKCTQVMSGFYRIDENKKKAKEVCYIRFDINKPHNIEIENDMGNSELTVKLSKQLEVMLKSPDYIRKLKKDHSLIKIRMAKNTGIKLKIGRNEDCVCGSGKKYKKCCMVKV
jgi:hypothetical protein